MDHLIMKAHRTLYKSLMNTDKEPIYESKLSTKVVSFIEVDKLTDHVKHLIDNSILWGIYKDENENLVAQDIFGNDHTDILK